MSPTAHGFFLTFLFLSFMLLVVGKLCLYCLDHSGHRAESVQTLKWRRHLVWMCVLLASATVFIGLFIWVADNASDIIPWYYVSGWTAVGVFVITSLLLTKIWPRWRSGPWVLVRLFVALFITVQAGELVGAVAESLVIRERLEQVKGSAYGSQGVYEWGDGGNTMTHSEGLKNYAGKWAAEWAGHLKANALVSLFLLPFLVLIERLRLGFNPLSLSSRQEKMNETGSS